jgi:hypothetical protein
MTKSFWPELGKRMRNSLKMDHMFRKFLRVLSKQFRPPKWLSEILMREFTTHIPSSRKCVL